MDERCEICGRPGLVVEVWVLDSNGRHHVATIHVVCENNRMMKMRLAGAAGRN